MKKFLYILLPIVLVLFACKRDKDILIELPLFPSEQIQSDIGGQIVDADQNPIQDADVILESNITQTDENGFFNFFDSKVNSRRSFIEISKSGYFKTTRAVIPQEEMTTNMKIQLIEKNLAVSFSAITGGEIEMSNGAELIIPADVITDVHGNSISGNVNVAMEYLNLDDESTFRKIPSDLKAVNLNGNQVLLEAFGFAIVDLTDDLEQPLKILSNENFEIRMPIPISLSNSIPNNLQLWSFDEENSIWKEIGIATVENNMIVANTDQVSFLAFGKSHEYVTVKGLLTNLVGSSLSNMPTTLEIQNGGLVGIGYTGIDGTWISDVPKLKQLEVFVRDDCGDIIYDASLGNYEEDLLIVDVKINNSDDFSNLSATLTNCNDNALENGYMKIEVGTKEYVFPISNGTFKADINACNSTIITMTAYDINAQQQTDPMEIELSQSVNMGEIKVCL